MRTGEVVRDPQGRAFQIGQQLGRGLWGRTFAAREEGAGEWVIKVPLGLSDVGEGGERLARACQEIVQEQGRLLQQAAGPGVVPCELVFKTAEGVPVLVLPRYASSLERRMQLGCSFEEVLRVIVEVARALRGLRGQSFHGALKPTNVLITDRGEVRLSDFVTPTLKRHMGALLRAVGQGSSYVAPEVRGATSEEPPLSVAADTYALAMMIYRGVLTDGAGGGPAPVLPEDGLDKAALVALKDRIHNRLKAEPSNPRFHTRLADRAAALLNRALSREVNPSPPFRFGRLDEFLARAEEVQALVHPVVTHVGKILLDRPPATEIFTTDEEATFSCTIACSAGVETHEEIATGLALFDQDRDERMREIQCSYTVDRHPSGRFRFGFRIAELAPATYKVRLAFTIRDSGHEPVTAEGRFHIRAAPGYVPPREQPASRPIPLERPAETIVTERRSVSGVSEAPRPVEPARPVEAPRPPEPARPAEAPRPSEPYRPVAVAPAPQPRVAPEPVRSFSEPQAQEPRLAPRPTAQRPEPVVRLAPPPPPVDEEVFDDEDDEDVDIRVPEIPAPAPPPRRAAVEEEDPYTASPQYRGAGRWTDLPVPGFEPRGRRDEDEDEGEQEVDATATQGTSATTGWRSAVAEPLQRLVDLARGEAYWLYIGGAVVIILVMLVLLLALNP